MKSLLSGPPPDRWESWVELDARAWPKKVEREYTLVPTICFNCEAACGLLAFVERRSGEIRKLEGHPLHPGSRGRNCAKGPATAAQLHNPDRIFHPLRRTGPRGAGGWERVSWDEALNDIAARIRNAILENRRDEVVYHVGRHGEDGFAERVLLAWGVDGHNSHTNVCSAGARTGYTFWMGYDRPAPDHANARFILLLSSHLESGHYFNPHAQRIVEARMKGARVAVIDPRLSNTASRADLHLSPFPGTEAGLLLAVARQLIFADRIDKGFIRRWVNWQQFMADRDYLQRLKGMGFLAEVPADEDFHSFLWCLRQIYSGYTPEWAERECGIGGDSVTLLAEEIARAGTAFASHVWRSAAQGHRGGWMVARALFFLHVLTGSVGTPGGCLPAGYCKFVPRPMTQPGHPAVWNESHFPPQFPLAHYEMSFLLPHLLETNGKRIDVYFTRVYNPVWTNPDGAMWVEMLADAKRIGLHVALTPVWSETAQYADYVLPMGLAAERHDIQSHETHPSQWLGFRQPVLRVAAERNGQRVGRSWETNPGEVWEETEFWIDLSWRIDPDGRLGIRRHFESPSRPGKKVTVDEYFGWIFDNSVPGLREEAAAHGLTPLAYMKRFGVFEVDRDTYAEYDRPAPEVPGRTAVDQATGALYSDSPPPRVNFRPKPGPFRDPEGRTRVGMMVDGQPKLGFPTPSGKLEFFSTTLRDWFWPEYAIPIHPRDGRERTEMIHITSQVHPATMQAEGGAFVLLPTFRLPTLIHTRTNGAKWLHELSHANPVWINPRDAATLGIGTGDLVRLDTEIGHLVDRAWVTEAIRPGVVACSHHLGRWRLHEDHGSDRWNSAVVSLTRNGTLWRMEAEHGPRPWRSADPDTARISWKEAGVHQNFAFPVQPDPISGAHCWHQKVRVRRAGPDDRYGSCTVDTARSRAVLRRWLELTRPAPGPDGMRRPYWLMRPLKPVPEAYRMMPAGDAGAGSGEGA